MTRASRPTAANRSPLRRRGKQTDGTARTREVKPAEIRTTELGCRDVIRSPAAEDLDALMPLALRPGNSGSSAAGRSIVACRLRRSEDANDDP